MKTPYLYYLCPVSGIDIKLCGLLQISIRKKGKERGGKKEGEKEGNKDEREGGKKEEKKEKIF